VSNKIAVTFLAAGALLSAASLAHAQQLAEEMSCAQAVVHYEQNGSIYVMTKRKFAVPVTVGTPIGQADTVYCTGSGAQPRPQTVRTRDKRRCAIAVRC
jgi:hypothetical protein